MQNFLKIWVREISRNIIAAVAIIGIAALAFAFTEPSVGPTGGTVYAPVNTSGTAQTKVGDFYSSGTVRGNIVNALSSLCINGSCISSWSSAGDAGLQRRVSSTLCSGANLSIKTINADGSVTCETDDGGAGGSGTVTSVGSGTGLTGGPITTSGTLSADTNYLQRRVSSTSCSGANLSIKTINADGTVSCETDDTGGAGGLSGSGTVNYVSKWTGGTSLGNSSIFDNGNVGIGTNNPTNKLTVGSGTSYDIIEVKKGAVHIKDPGYSGSTLQLFARDIHTSNDEALFLNYDNASGNVHIGGEGENKVIYMGGGSGATGSGSYVDAPDYWIRSVGKWASQLGGGGGDITAVSPGAGSGLSGGGTSGDVTLSLAQSCPADQFLKGVGTSYACAYPSTSSGQPQISAEASCYQPKVDGGQIGICTISDNADVCFLTSSGASDPGSGDVNDFDCRIIKSDITSNWYIYAWANGNDVRCRARCLNW